MSEEEPPEAISHIFNITLDMQFRAYMAMAILNIKGASLSHELFYKYCEYEGTQAAENGDFLEADEWVRVSKLYKAVQHYGENCYFLISRPAVYLDYCLDVAKENPKGKLIAHSLYNPNFEKIYQERKQCAH